MKDYLIEVAKNIDMGLNVIFWTLWVLMMISCISDAVRGELKGFRVWFANTMGIIFILMLLWPSDKFWDKF